MINPKTIKKITIEQQMLAETDSKSKPKQNHHSEWICYTQQYDVSALIQALLYGGDS